MLVVDMVILMLNRTYFKELVLEQVFFCLVDVRLGCELLHLWALIAGSRLLLLHFDLGGALSSFQTGCFDAKFLRMSLELVVEAFSRALLYLILHWVLIVGRQWGHGLVS